MATPRRVEGKVALVVGAASGIGRATAIVLAKNGAIVWCSDRTVDGPAETAGPSTLRSEHQTIAPFFASTIAVARPIPEAAPTTRATLPSTRRGVAIPNPYHRRRPQKR